MDIRNYTWVDRSEPTPSSSPFNFATRNDGQHTVHVHVQYNECCNWCNKRNAFMIIIGIIDYKRV